MKDWNVWITTIPGTAWVKGSAGSTVGLVAVGEIVAYLGA